MKSATVRKLKRGTTLGLSVAKETNLLSSIALVPLYSLLSKEKNDVSITVCTNEWVLAQCKLMNKFLALFLRQTVSEHN
jgi:hypothetical protein